METQINLTQHTRAILNAVAQGKHEKQQIADFAHLRLQTVAGGLRQLKRQDLVDTEDGIVRLKAGAMVFLDVRKPRTGTKMEQARIIFAKFANQGRQAVLDHLQRDVRLTKAGASTYYQNLRIENQSE